MIRCVLALKKNGHYVCSNCLVRDVDDLCYDLNRNHCSLNAADKLVSSNENMFTSHCAGQLVERAIDTSAEYCITFEGECWSQIHIAKIELTNPPEIAAA